MAAEQLSLLPEPEPAPERLTTNEVRQSIDDLVGEAWQYRRSADFRELLEFMGRFRQQKPFNALLLHIQLPGATYVETARVWRERYGRVVKPGQRPLVVLWTFGPVMFMYDVSQTEPDPGAPCLPLQVEAPFTMPPIVGVDRALAMTIGNAKRDGVRVTAVPSGSVLAGCIRMSQGSWQEVVVGRRPRTVETRSVCYDVEHNDGLAPTEVYATLAHELGHLYCGHLGTPNPKWWPDRSRLSKRTKEFEAEAVGYVACKRLYPEAELPPYLASYLEGPDVPGDMSLEAVVRAAGTVVDMAAKRLPMRKDER